MAKKAKQEALPGMERAVHKDITKAAEALVDVRDTRMEWTKKEVEKQTALAATMKAHGVTTYTDPDAEIEVTLSVKEKVKVRSLTNGDEPEDAE